MGKAAGARGGGMDARAHWSVVLLATASGAVDALALTALGHVFAGVMTPPRRRPARHAGTAGTRREIIQGFTD